MRRDALLLPLLLATITATPTRARACEPTDERAYVAAAGDDFVFVSANRLVRVAPSGEVRLRRTLSDESGALAMLGDGRTLLQVVPVGSSTDCEAAGFRFELIDTLSTSPARVIGSVRGRTWQAVRSITLMDDGALTVRMANYNVEEDALTIEDAVVRADTRRVRVTRVAGPDDDEPPPPRGRRASGPLHLAPASDQDSHVRVVDASERVRVTVQLTHWPASVALSAEGRYLAVATYANHSEDYGTGSDARLERVDLTNGAWRTLVGTGSGIPRVEGAVRLECANQVHDPDSALNVRAAPNARAAVVSTLAHGARVEVAETRGSWQRLSAPAAGWVWGASIRQACSLGE